MYGVPSMDSSCETKQIQIGHGLPPLLGRNKSRWAKYPSECPRFRTKKPTKMQWAKTSLPSDQEGKTAQRESYQAGHSCGRPGVIRAEVPGQKFRAGPRNLGRTNMWARTSMTRSARMSPVRGVQKNFNWFVVPCQSQSYYTHFSTMLDFISRKSHLRSHSVTVLESIPGCNAIIWV